MTNYIPGTATSLTTKDVLALQRTAQNSRAQQDSVRASIFTKLKTRFSTLNDNTIVIKEPGVMLDVTNTGNQAVGGGQHVVLAMRLPLTYAPAYGTANDVLGNEQETPLRYTQLEYNEIKMAVKYNTWGYDFNDTEYLSFNEGYSEYVGLYWQELDDYRAQMTLLLGKSEELTYAPVSAVQTFNKNWAIPNLASQNYPSYAVTAITDTAGAPDSLNWYSSRLFSGAGTFAETLGAAMIAAAGTSAVSKATLTVDAVLQILAWIKDQHVVEPLMMGGKAMWIWKVPTMVMYWMLNPNKTGSLAKLWTNVRDYDQEQIKLPGEFGMIAGCIRMIEDPRCATLTVGGNGTTYTLTPGYIRPGNNDDRNNSAWGATSGMTNYVWDISTILGLNALGLFRKDDLKTGLIQSTEFGKREGRAAYKGEGLQLPMFNTGTVSAANSIYRGSCVVPISRDPIQTLS